MKRAPARPFRTWSFGRKTTDLYYRFRHSAEFPRSEIDDLTQQIHRAAVSIPANIAEGFKKRGRTDKARFMNISQGSLEETRYYLILAADLGYLKPGALLAQVDEIGRILDAYSRSLLSPVSCLLTPVS